MLKGLSQARLYKVCVHDAFKHRTVIQSLVSSVMYLCGASILYVSERMIIKRYHSSTFSDDYIYPLLH